MATSDDEEFLRIFEDNNLEEILQESETNISVTIKDLQEGLANLIHIAAFISEFIVEFFNAVEEGDEGDTPTMKTEIILQLLNIFQSNACLIESIDVECDDEDDD
jgi:hypothetical protein